MNKEHHIFMPVYGAAVPTISGADIGFSGVRKIEGIFFRGHSEPPPAPPLQVTPGCSPRSQRIQSYLQPKISLKWQCQRKLASECFA